MINKIEIGELGCRLFLTLTQKELDSVKNGGLEGVLTNEHLSIERPFSLKISDSCAYYISGIHVEMPKDRPLRYFIAISSNAARRLITDGIIETKYGTNKEPINCEYLRIEIK